MEVKLSLPQAPPAYLREDMTLSVQVETGRRERTLVVPVQALAGDREARSDGTATVFVARDGRVEPRRLRLGLATLEAVEVLEGLSAGDIVLLGPAPAAGRRVHADTSATAQRAAQASREDVGSALGNAMGR